jgi:hypothetical protein
MVHEAAGESPQPSPGRFPGDPRHDAPEQAPPAPRARAPRRRPKPWERQAGEGAQAFAAAEAYFVLGADRSLARVGQKRGKSRSLLERWSQEWRWVERAEAYDRRMARVAQRARERALVEETEKWARRRDEIREREWRIAETMQGLGEKILADEGAFTRDHKLGDAVTLIRRASELARLAAEMPTRPPACPPSGPPGPPPSGAATYGPRETQ